MAPFTPFLAEELYRKMTGGESVHLLDWPKAGHIDELALSRMQFVREAITDGLSQRAEAGIKVRQPLQWVSTYDERQQLTSEVREIIAEELNIKEVRTRTNPEFSGTATCLSSGVSSKLSSTLGHSETWVCQRSKKVAVPLNSGFVRVANFLDV